MQQPEPVQNPLALSVRNIGATAAGFIAGWFIISLVQQAGYSVYPTTLGPASTREDFIAYAESATAMQNAFPLAAVFLGTFAAAYLAQRLGRITRPVNSIVAAALLGIVFFLTLSQFPRPFWFIAVSYGLMAFGAWLGYRLAKRGGKGEIIV